MSDSDKNPGGRPTDFKEEYIEQAYVACAEGGFTNPKLGKLFKVTSRTVSNWMRNVPEFKAAVIKGKDEYDSIVIEAALVKRAKGFRYTETTSELMWIDDPKASYQPTPMQQLHGIPRTKINTYVPTKKISKVVVPDTRACEIHLYNRSSGRWKRLKHVEVAGPGGGPIETKRLTDFPKEPETIKEWERQVRDSEANETNEETPTS